jgi:hypothetical protein
MDKVIAKPVLAFRRLATGQFFVLWVGLTGYSHIGALLPELFCIGAPAIRMPRPNPPPPIARPAVHAFHLADSEKRDLVRILARDSLPPETAEAIAAAISAYKATEAGAADTTIGNTVAALTELTRPAGRGYKRAVRRMSDDSGGVDDTTLARCNHSRRRSWLAKRDRPMRGRS